MFFITEQTRLKNYFKRMKKAKFSIAHEDMELVGLVAVTDQRVLARWAIECAERVMHFFEKKYSEDDRPRTALKVLEKWLADGEFKMAVIRKASLDAHASAREVGEDSPARSTARACGQAVATAHVARHAYGSAIYAQQAIFRASSPSEADSEVLKERNWQYQRLVEMRQNI